MEIGLGGVHNKKNNFLKLVLYVLNLIGKTQK